MTHLRMVAAGLVLLLLGSAAWVSSLPGSGALYGEQVIATGQFDCDGQQHEASWVNESGRALRVRQSQIWIGMFRGSKADIWVWLAADGSGVLDHSNWDHYQDPTGPHDLRRSFAPDYVEVAPGAAVTLGYGCQDIARGGAVGDVAVTLWWVR